MAGWPPSSAKRTLAAAANPLHDGAGLSGRSAANGTSSTGSINGAGEKAKLLPPPPPPNPEDKQDKGCTPLTVQRHCTDVVWNFPFLGLLALSAWITFEAYQVGRPETIFRLPDFQSNLCGKGHHEGKSFLYFCMKRASEWVFDEANKSLEERYPICVARCPRSFNTSSRCYLGTGQVSDVNSWDFIQDYPTQPMAFFCRPHRAYSKGLSDDFWRAVRKGPPTSYLILAFYNGWPQVTTIAVMSSACFSFFYIVSLSRCARTLIWLSLTLVELFAALMCLFYGYCFKSGECKRWTGNEKEDPLDLLRCVAAGAVALFVLKQMCSLSSKLDMVGRILEMACRCIMSSPMLAVLPMVILCLRVALTIWLLYVIICLYSDEIQDCLDGIDQPWVDGWSRLPSVNKSIEFRVYVIIAIIFCAWSQAAVTAFSWFVMVFVAQVWYFAGPKFSVRRCNVLKAFCICLRYHSGTVILAGLLHLIIGPLHGTLGKLQEENQAGNPLAAILQTCLSCCMDFYSHFFAHLSRDALQDVSLQAFNFYEGADHMALQNEEGKSLSSEVAILNTSTFLFQAAGVGCAAVISWFACANTLTQKHFSDMDSQFYVEDKATLCLAGTVLAVLAAMPFMTVFDVVSDAVLYSKVVDKQRNPKGRGMQSASGMLFRNCAPWGQTIRDITSCNCAYRSGSGADFESQGFGLLGFGSTSFQVQGSPSTPAVFPTSPFVDPR